ALGDPWVKTVAIMTGPARSCPGDARRPGRRGGSDGVADSEGHCRRLRLLGRQRTRQPAARVRPLSPDQDAAVTAPSPWMFAAPPFPWAVWASRTAFSGRLASKPKTSPYHPNPLSRCARRSDDTDAPSGVASGPMAAGSAFMLPHL